MAWSKLRRLLRKSQQKNRKYESKEARNKKKRKDLSSSNTPRDLEITDTSTTSSVHYQGELAISVHSEFAIANASSANLTGYIQPVRCISSSKPSSSATNTNSHEPSVVSILIHEPSHSDISNPTSTPTHPSISAPISTHQTISAPSPISTYAPTPTPTPSAISTSTHTPSAISTYAPTPTHSSISAPSHKPSAISANAPTSSIISVLTFTSSTISANTPTPSVISASTPTPTISAHTPTHSTIPAHTPTHSTISATECMSTSESSSAMNTTQIKTALKSSCVMDDITNQLDVNGDVSKDADCFTPDVSIKIGDQRFHAHKNILSRFSEYFCSHATAAVPLKMELRGINQDSFKAYLECLYSGELKMTPATIADLLMLSEALGVPFLREKCMEYTGAILVDQALAILTRCLSPNNALWKRAFDTVMEHVTTIDRFDHFFKLHCDTLCRLLSDDNIVIDTELDVVRLGIKWVDHDKKHRNCHTLCLVECARFAWMEPADVYKSIEMAASLKDNPSFERMIFKANWLATCRIENLADIFDYKVRPRRACFVKRMVSQSVTTEHDESDGFWKREIVLVLGNFKQSSHTAKTTPIMQTDGEEKEWHHQMCMPMSRIYYAAAIMNGKVYITGGTETKSGETEKPGKDAYCFDPVSKQWEKVRSMQKSRMNHCLVALNGTLYAIGGIDEKNKVLNSVELYNPQTDVWQFGTAMPTPRFSMSAATLKGMIYVVGGQGRKVDAGCGYPLLKKVEMYNQQTNCWSKMKRLQFPRCNCNLVNVDEELYLCGGIYRPYGNHAETIVLNGIDIYNAKKDRWEHVTYMTVPRQNAGACAIGNKIYVVGGESSAIKQLKSIEVFDTKKRTCVGGIRDLPCPSRWITCVVVPRHIEVS